MRVLSPLAVCVACPLLFFATVGWSADFNKGLQAWETGDYQVALDEWLPLAKDGDARAQHNLGTMFARGVGVPQNSREAVRWFGQAARQGLSSAQYALGRLHEDGDGVAKDKVEAAMWFRRAAEQGHRAAQAALGGMYAAGDGVPMDDAEAAKWYLLAAQQGDTLAQANMGWMYANGVGVAANADEAVKWYALAAEKGDAVAQGNLGWIYLSGSDVPKNEAEGLRLLRLAGEQGYLDAQVGLWKHLVRRGLITRGAAKEGVFWMRKAAEQMHSESQYALGVILLSGDVGQKMDIEAAYGWLSLALANGLQGAEGPQQEAATQLSKVERAEVDEKVRECMSAVNGPCDL